MNYIDLFIQIFTGLLSLMYLARYRTKFLFFVTILLVLTSVVETFGEYTVMTGKSSFLVYHVFSIFQFTIIYLIYLILVKDKIWRNLFTFLHVFFIFTWISVFLNQKLFFYLLILGAFNTSLFVVFYLRSILISDKILNYKKLFPFWISVGFLVFYLPSIPFFFLFKTMKDRGLFFVLNGLVILMNLFIIYGLITCNKEEKY